jgi:hypothetical protein
MASRAGFIEGRLRLKINQDKSAVARPEDRHFLGFRLRLDPQTEVVEILLSQRTKRNAMQKIRQLTPRPWGRTLDSCILQANAWLRGEQLSRVVDEAMKDHQAAAFSLVISLSSSVTRMPSLNFTPASTSVTSSWPLNRRQRSCAASSSL